MRVSFFSCPYLWLEPHFLPPVHQGLPGLPLPPLRWHQIPLKTWCQCEAHLSVSVISIKFSNSISHNSNCIECSWAECILIQNTLCRTKKLDWKICLTCAETTNAVFNLALCTRNTRVPKLERKKSRLESGHLWLLAIPTWWVIVCLRTSKTASYLFLKMNKCWLALGDGQEDWDKFECDLGGRGRE